MSITIRDNQPQESKAVLHEYLNSDAIHGDHCLIESIAFIVTRQVDDSLCVIALMDELTFAVYQTGAELLNDFDLDGSEEIIILDSIDITYYKQMK